LPVTIQSTGVGKQLYTNTRRSTCITKQRSQSQRKAKSQKRKHIRAKRNTNGRQETVEQTYPYAWRKQEVQRATSKQSVLVIPT
jgi:hypothetical protein